jgi:hypothetical protein
MSGMQCCIEGFHFHWVLFIKCSQQFLEHLKVLSHIYGFPFQQKINQYASQKTNPIILLAKGMVLACVFFGEIV